MRSAVLSLAALLVLAPIASAENIGSSFGSVTTAKATGQGQTTINGTVGVTDNTAFVASINHGFSKSMDARFRVAAVDYEFFNTAIALKADARWQLWDEDTMSMPSNGMKKQRPFDMALGGFVEWMSLDSEILGAFIESQTVWQVGAQMTGSHTIHFSNGGTLAPYGTVNLRWESFNVNTAPGLFGGISASDSHMALGLNGGVAWGPTQSILLFAELQIDGNDGLFLGIDYKL